MAGDWRKTRLTTLVGKVAGCLPEWEVHAMALAREPRPGLWHVIDFQLDKYVTSRRFTINAGLHDARLEPLIPEWARLEPERPNVGACNLGRARLGRLIDYKGLGRLINDKSRWWDLPSEDRIDSLSRELCSLLMKFAIPDLDRLRSSQTIAEAWITSVHASRFFTGSQMVLAAVLKDAGRDQEAREVAAAEVAASAGHPSEAWVKTMAARLGV